MIGSRLFAVACLLPLLACSEPYSQSVGKINEDPPQTHAIITISDPQLYTRERLLNDRDAEAAYLTEQLKHVDDQDYTPRLKRDLDSLLEVAAALTLKFDPTAGASIQQAAQVGSLKNEAEIEKLRNLLDDIKANHTLAADTEGDTTGVDESKLTPDVDTLFAQINTALTNLEAAIAKRPGVVTPRTNTVTSATPSEVLDDKLAYRHKIRAALDEAQLDDRHDLSGNSLYTLSFSATVFPGEKKDKYAVAKVTIIPPTVTDDEISDLYLRWLAHITRQLNVTPPDTQAAGADTPSANLAAAAVSDRYRLLGPATGLYNVAAIPLQDPANPTKVCSGREKDESLVIANCSVFYIPTLPEFTMYDVSFVASTDRTNELIAFFNMLSDKFLRQELTAHFTDAKSSEGPKKCGAIRFDNQTGGRAAENLNLRIVLSDADQRNKIKELQSGTPLAHYGFMDAWVGLIWAKHILNLAPTYALAIDKSRKLYRKQKTLLQDLDGDAARLVAAQRAATAYLSTVFSLQTSDAECNSLETLKGRVWSPEPFYRTVRAYSKNALQGETYAYSTAPAELEQRISTVASATQALDLMASVSAILPSSGVGIGAQGAMRQVATGRVDAIESTPLIVGFSNNGGQNDDAMADNSSFGWVFGPKLVSDTANKKLALTQTLRNQNVTASISIPAWWPSVGLQVETAWAGNFNDFTIATGEKPGVRTFQMKVPLNGATPEQETYEHLTEYVAGKIWGDQRKDPVITAVYPSSVVTCEDIKVLISGSDLWRGHDVYLNGVAASSVKIMKDMQGLEASFKLPASANASPGQLLVWTQLGKVEYLEGLKVTKGNCKDSAKDTAAKTDDLPVLATAGLPLILNNEKLVVRSDAVKAANTYNGVIIPAGGDGSVKVALAAKTNVVATDGVLTISPPGTASIANSLGLGANADGQALTIIINQVAKDGSATPQAKVTPLYLLTRKIEEILATTSSATFDKDSSSGAVSIALPVNFDKIYKVDFSKAVVTPVGGGSNAINVSGSSKDGLAKITFGSPADWSGHAISRVKVNLQTVGIAVYEVDVAAP